MLVLSRKSSETIRIGDNVTVEVRRIAGNRVTLAISAPRDVRILRGELEQAATEFEVTTLEPAAVEPTPVDSGAEESDAEPYGVTHQRIPMPRLHQTFDSNQAVG